MIPYKIFPHFELGPFHVNMYGIMFAAGLLVAALLAKREAEKKGERAERIYDLVVWLIIGIIAGARLFYVLFYWPEASPLSLASALSIWKGGLSFFGGLAGAIAAGSIYVYKHRLSFWLYTDIFAIPLVAGHILGRLGDWFTGGHPGKLTMLPWAIYHEGAFRHPVVLYEIIGLGVILFLLILLKKAKERENIFSGFLFLSYLGLYSLQRLILDIFRVESTDPRYYGLTPSQSIAVILILAAIIMLYLRRERRI